MRPLAALEREEARALDGLVVDLDDTVLDHGLLTERAYAAVFRAREAGLPIVVATGRPLGWAEVVARTWPIDGAIAENGAVAARREGSRLVRVDALSDEARSERRARLLALAETLVARFPSAALADDNALRRTDVTIDVAEARAVPAAEVRALVALAREAGVRTTVSSVHLHLSYDTHDKASGTIAYLLATRGVDPTRARSRWAFVGDSGNDAPCFAAFRTSFGVANVREHLAQLSVAPSYVAPEPRGQGFAAIVETLARLRATKSY